MKGLLIRMLILKVLALLVLVVAGCSPQSAQGESLDQINPASSTSTAAPNSAEETSGDSQVDAGTQLPAAVEPTNLQVPPTVDGSSLLQVYCAKCHSVRMLEKTDKTRAEWEKTLVRMEKKSPPMSDTERSAMLDYLSIPDKP